MKAQLDGVEQAIAKSQGQLDAATREHSKLEERRAEAERQRGAAEADLAALAEDLRAWYFPKLEAARSEALGEHRLTVKSCDGCERKMRDWLQGRIDAESHKLTRLRDRIVAAMRDYANLWPEETREVDATVEAATEFRQMLAALESDGLPQFEARFKSLLNENTIREVAGFQSQLRREARRSASASRSSTSRWARSTITQPLHRPGGQSTSEPEVRDFRRAFAPDEDALTGSDGQAYSEAKFLR